MPSLTRIGRLCAKEFLSHNSFLELLIDFKEQYLGSTPYELCLTRAFSEPMRFAFKRLITGVPPHQIDAQNPFFQKIAPFQALSLALEGLAQYYLVWMGRPTFRMSALLDWQDDSQSIMTAQLTGACMTLAHGRGHVSTLHRLAVPQAMPDLKSPMLQSTYARGLVDLHQHYNASGLPTDIWSKAVAEPGKILAKSYGFEDDTENFPQGWAKLDIYAHLINARWIRRYLSRWVKEKPIYKHEEKLRNFAELVHECYKGKKSLPQLPVQPMDEGDFQDECLFIASVLIAMKTQLGYLGEQEAFLLYFCFHYYLLIQNIFMQNYVQQDEHFGFESFSRFERGTGLQAYKQRTFADATKSYVRDHRLQAIEPRIVPPDNFEEYGDLNDQFDEAKVDPSIKWGLIFHLIKQKDPHEHLSGPLIVARHHQLRHQTYHALFNLLASRKIYPKLASRYLALDAANDERFAGPEVFAASFRLFRDRFGLPPEVAPARLTKHLGPLKPLAITFHAGESFEHPLSGIRYVDEALDFLDMRPGDRIGHGLALGTDLEQWHRIMGEEVAFANQGQWLDNMLWMLDQSQTCDFSPAVRDFLNNKCTDMALTCYCEGLIDKSGDPRKPHLLRLARTFRRAEPSQALHHLEPAFRQEIELIKQATYGSRAKKLWDHYHFCPECRKAYRQPLIITGRMLPPRDQWFEALEQCQQVVLQRLHDREISIEVNPTSNLRIGQFSRMKDHPIFSWLPVNPIDRKPRPTVTVNADNYCVFQTTLPLEYAYLARAAGELGYANQQVAEWLELIRKNGVDYSFIPIYS